MELNSTIHQPNQLTFESATAVLHDTYILFALGLIWLLPLVIYLFIGVLVRGRSSSGSVTSKVMAAYPNFWYAVAIWGLIQFGLFFLIVFPIWLRWLS